MKSKQRHPVSLKQYRKLCGKWQCVPVARDVNGNSQTPEMLDFCGQHNITSDVEVIPIQKLNDAYGPGTSNLDEIRIVCIGWMEDALVEQSLKWYQCVHPQIPILGPGDAQTPGKKSRGQRSRPGLRIPNRPVVSPAQPGHITAAIQPGCGKACNNLSWSL